MSGRERLPREASLRFVVAPDGRLVGDPLMKLPGRGAHTCPKSACLRRAVERGGFARSLKQRVVLPRAEELIAHAGSASLRRCHELLGLLRRGDHIVPGARPVQEYLKQGELGLVLVARDHSERSAADVLRAAERSGAICVRFSTAEALGRSIGRKLTGVLGCHPGRLQRALSLEVEKATSLSLAEGMGGESV